MTLEAALKPLASAWQDDEADAVWMRTHVESLRRCRSQLHRALAARYTELTRTDDAIAHWRALEAARQVPLAQRHWALDILAGLAEHLGRSDGAERHYQSAIAAGPMDAALRNRYADLLLRLRRPADGLALLAGENDEGAQLRRALASHLLSHTVTPLRFDTARHAGDAARFALVVEGRPREPADALILLQAALPAGEPGAAQSVSDWTAETGLRSSVLAPYLTELEAAQRRAPPAAGLL